MRALSQHKDVLEPHVLFILVATMTFMHVAVRLGFDTSNLCDSWFDKLWPLNDFYKYRFSNIGVDINKSCYVTVSISENLTILLFSFTIAFVNRLQYRWLRTRTVATGSWPLKVTIYLFVLTIYISFQNFSDDSGFLSLDIDRPLWISITIITIFISVMLFLLLHLIIHLLKITLQRFFPSCVVDE